MLHFLVSRMGKGARKAAHPGTTPRKPSGDKGDSSVTEKRSSSKLWLILVVAIGMFTFILHPFLT